MALSRRQGRFVTNYGLAGTGLACVLTILTLPSVSGVLETALQSFAIAIPASAGAGLIAAVDEDLKNPLSIKFLPILQFVLSSVGLLGNLHGIQLLFRHMSPLAAEYLIKSAVVVFFCFAILDLADRTSKHS